MLIGGCAYWRCLLGRGAYWEGRYLLGDCACWGEVLIGEEGTYWGSVLIGVGAYWGGRYLLGECA